MNIDPEQWEKVPSYKERLRDEFAMAALTGCLAYSHLNPMSGNFQENSNIEKDCEHFYKYADAMLKASEVKP